MFPLCSALSRQAADCGCPAKHGLLLEVKAYAYNVAGLSCTDSYEIDYTALRTRQQLARDSRPVTNTTEVVYMGFGTILQGGGRSVSGEDVSASLTFVTKFGMPVAGQRRSGSGRKLLADAGVNNATVQTVIIRKGGKTTIIESPDVLKQRAYKNWVNPLPSVFGPAPPAPLPLPNLPFLQGGRMMITWRE